MKQKLMRIVAASGLVMIMGLGVSAIPASAKTTKHTTKKTTISGKVTSAPAVVSGTQYTMTVKAGKKSYAVTFDTASAKIVNHKGDSITVDKVVDGNKVQVKGTTDTSTKKIKITKVSKITDDSIS